MQRSKGQLSFVLFFAEAKFSAWNLFKLSSRFRPDLDGNKLATSICLARKARDIEVFI